MSNPYTAAAAELIRHKQFFTPPGMQERAPLPPTPMAIGEAMVQATLALAYEQRTANLIAMEAQFYKCWKEGGLNPRERERWEEIGVEIKERMEL